jgi:hypothetical protein
MIIAIDFDSTITTGPYPVIGSAQHGAKDCINRLYSEGHYIIINTCRCGTHLLDAINWLLHQGINFHRVNDNNPVETARYNNNSRKIFAHLYIDDKQIGELPPWNEIYDFIINTDNLWKASVRASLVDALVASPIATSPGIAASTL